MNVRLQAISVSDSAVQTREREEPLMHAFLEGKVEQSLMSVSRHRIVGFVSKHQSFKSDAIDYEGPTEKEHGDRSVCTGVIIVLCVALTKQCPSHQPVEYISN